MDHHPHGLLSFDDIQDVLIRQRLEVQPVRGVVIGAHGFRVAIDHDRLDALFAERKRGVYATVIELDALPDAIGTAAQYHDLLPIGRPGFTALSIGRVEIGRVRLELRGTGIHPFVGHRRPGACRCALGDRLSRAPDRARVGFQELA